MGGTGVIDGFLGVFTRYIDSGFGLVQGDVRWLAGVLIAIDITLAGIFWAMAPDEDVLARLIKKTFQNIGRRIAYALHEVPEPARPDVDAVVARAKPRAAGAGR